MEVSWAKSQYDFWFGLHGNSTFCGDMLLTSCSSEVVEFALMSRGIRNVEITLFEYHPSIQRSNPKRMLGNIARRQCVRVAGRRSLHSSRQSLLNPGAAQKAQPVQIPESKDSITYLESNTGYQNPLQHEQVSRALRVSNGSLDLLTSPEHRLWLRDVCTCPKCVDSSTSQKQFQTCDLISRDSQLKPEFVEETDTHVTVRWLNDHVAGPDHVSTYSKAMLKTYGSPTSTSNVEGFGLASQRFQEVTWDQKTMSSKIQFIPYEDYMKSDNVVFKALHQLKVYGLVFIRGVPTEETEVETVANRIGHLRETFYGRTWNVKSVPQAKNVAYTNQFLGFHMDLLYMSDPPGLQLLHSLKNTCAGGASMFSDSFYAVEKYRQNGFDDKALLDYQQTFHYDNAGEHYRYTRPVVVPNEDKKSIDFVNWSPPFQGPFKCEDHPNYLTKFDEFAIASRRFSDIVEDPNSIYEYRMEQGDCVIFNNRRVLHARREFDTTSGERWLKGAYIDTDVFNSRYRVLLRRDQEAHPSRYSSD